jgi:hypothetical protein
VDHTIKDLVQAAAGACRCKENPQSGPCPRCAALIYLDRLDQALSEARKHLTNLIGALGVHYCGVCGNLDGEGREQPYRDVRDTATECCDQCRPTVVCLQAARDFMEE